MFKPYLILALILLSAPQAFALTMPAAVLGAPLRYIVLEEARSEDRASTQGLLNIFLAVGQLSGAAIVGAVATSVGGGTVGYQNAIGVLAVITFLMCMVALLLKRRASSVVVT